MTTKPDSNSINTNNQTDPQNQNGQENTLVKLAENAAESNKEENTFVKVDTPVKKKAPIPGINIQKTESNQTWITLAAVVVMTLGLVFDVFWMGFSGMIVALLVSLRVIIPSFTNWLIKHLPHQDRKLLVGLIGFFGAGAGLLKYLGFYDKVTHWLVTFKYDEFGSWAEWVGAVGQISIAMLAVYVAWQQYVISKDLTIQQNRITQQQTIDSYFQGIAELVLSQEGLLEDWPQERAIAEGRTAALLGSVDGAGKAKILRFLSQSRLLTPLMRDSHLGRPILDGSGGYAEDRPYGIRVIDLGVMLAGTNLSGQDLRWTELSEANMVRVNLSYCDLVKANLSRTVLYQANLVGADLKSARLFYGVAETASPRSRKDPANYETGAYTGAVVESANFNGTQRLSDEQRYYICAWGGEKTRSTVPGGCEGIPNKLGR